MATENPWYGYKRIAVMCRRAGAAVTDRQAYRVMKDHGLLAETETRKAEVYQAAKLFELLPQGPNDLWQMDVTYIHIPGYGWWYAVTVIDYYSRYLLACHLTASYSAIDVIHALKLAREEAERIHGPLAKRPFLVTDNGSSFIARRFGAYVKDRFAHVRIQYRTPQQLGLLERFHKTLKDEEVYWRLYDNPQHAGSAWPSSASVTTAASALGADAGGRRRRAHAERCLPRRTHHSDSALAAVGPRGPGEIGGDADRGVGHPVRISLASCERPGRSLPPLDPG